MMGIMSDTTEANITDIVEVAPSTGEVVDEVIEYPPLTQEEDTFALAVIEYGGNLASAYRAAFGKDVDMPAARGKALMNKAAIALRVRELSDNIGDAALVSLGAHLQELADIRDLSKVTGQLKVALAAEQARGEVVGLYKEARGTNNKAAVVANITFVSKHDSNI